MCKLSLIGTDKVENEKIQAKEDQRYETTDHICCTGKDKG